MAYKKYWGRVEEMESARPTKSIHQKDITRYLDESRILYRQAEEETNPEKKAQLMNLAEQKREQVYGTGGLINQRNKEQGIVWQGNKAGGRRRTRKTRRVKRKVSKAKKSRKFRR